MSFKQYFLLLPVAAATLLAYCTKEQSLPTPTSNTENGIASDRTKCTVTVTVNTGAVQVCGTNTMVTSCNTVGGELLYGTANLTAATAPGVYGIQTASGSTPDGFLRITTANPGVPTSVTVATASGSVTFSYPTANGNIQDIRIDPFCVPVLF